MPSLSQSPVLQALGYAIANSLWQMAIVWIVYVLLNSIFKFRSEIKFRIAVAAQVIGFSWFIVTLQFYYQQCSQALDVAESVYLQAGDQQTYVVATEKGSLLNYFLKAEQLMPYLSVAYLLLLAFLTIRWLRAYRYTQLVRLNGLHKIDVDWKLFVNKVAGQLGIKQKVRIFLSEIVQSPVTIGFLKPVILIPIASINHLTPQQLEAIILHELAHIRRHDYLLNIVLSIIELGLFFNPFTRLITKSVSKERENSCDDWVLQYQYNPSMYAEALLRIAVLQKTPSVAMYAVKTKGELLSRVQRMVHQKDTRFNYRHQLIALLLMTGILASLAWFDPASVKNRDTMSLARQQAVVPEPLAAKIDNPLFNPMFLLNAALKEEVKETMNRANVTQAKRQKTISLSIDQRQLVLPRVMAPVAIENLREIEMRLAVSEKELKTALSRLSKDVPVAQKYVTQFDSLRFNGKMAFQNYFGQQEMFWQNMEKEMQALQQSRKAIEDAVRKGTISKAMARTQLAELTEAMQQLNELKIPQVYSFAPGVNGNQFVFHNWNQGPAETEKKLNEDKKRTHVHPGGTNTRTRKMVTDTLKQKLLATTVIKGPHQPADHYRVMGDASTFVVLDGRSMAALKELPKVPVRTLFTRSQYDEATGYVFREYEDECEKANLTERRRVIKAAVGTGKGKGKTPTPVPVKTKSKTTKATCTTATATVSANGEDGELVIVEVHVQ